MNDVRLHRLDQLRIFINSTVAVDFSVDVDERYDFITCILRRFGCARLRRANKGVVLRLLGRVGGFSCAQLTRLVERGRQPDPLARQYLDQRIGFTRTCTDADVLLLAHTDTLQDALFGTATKKLVESAFTEARPTHARARNLRARLSSAWDPARPRHAAWRGVQARSGSGSDAGAGTGPGRRAAA